MAPFVPASQVSTVTVGNEILESTDAFLSARLLLAMQNLQYTLSATSLSSSVKVSIVNNMVVLIASKPPSSGAFHSELLPAIQGILMFLQETGSPFTINSHPLGGGGERFIER